MGPIAKLIIGIVLVLIGLYWYLGPIPIIGGVFWPLLLKAFYAMFGLLLILIGAFLAWLEYDEWKTQKEIAKEERKARSKRKRK